MGIPSYFSQIIRKYANILRNSKHFDNDENKLTHLYMDCNSIIYDSYHSLSSTYDKENEGQFEKTIIHETARRIDEYITQIKPTDVVYISFDGVAPLAKMEQQRKRRYRTMFLSQIKYSDEEDVPDTWDTCKITPGTDFMGKLSNYMYFYFGHTELKYNVSSVIISCADKEGEGEHKIYSHIRHNDVKYANIAVYGLDADLIMLSIFHMKYCNSIYVCREAPEFLKSSIPVDIKTGDNQSYFVDIKRLSESILKEMNCKEMIPVRIDDYVFMCFFLGNDFLPHFPALNIRTNGMAVLMDVYRKYIGNSARRSLISPDTKEIQWEYVKLFLSEIAKMERDLMIQEHAHRDKLEKRRYPETTPKEKEEALMNAPIMYRQGEKYVCPTEDGWEERFHKLMLPENVDLQDVCDNYIEGLIWVYKYYTEDCTNWRWKYRYNSMCVLRVLLIRLCVGVGVCVVDSVCVRNSSYSVCESLMYVLPRVSVCGSVFECSCSWSWSYCRYFWECAPLLRA